MNVIKDNSTVVAMNHALMGHKDENLRMFI